jgi:hypothetical protein
VLIFRQRGGVGDFSDNRTQGLLCRTCYSCPAELPKQRSHFIPRCTRLIDVLESSKFRRNPTGFYKKGLEQFFWLLFLNGIPASAGSFTLLRVVLWKNGMRCTCCVAMGQPTGTFIL